MNAHKLRSILNRQNVVPCAVFFLLILVVVCGLTAGTRQSSAQVNVSNGRGNQRPPEFANRNAEDIKKDFNDDDLKVKEQKPRGKWSYGILVDRDQFNDASVPVAVGAYQSLSGGGKYLGVVKIKRLEIKNRSSKAVNSVQLRWKITSLDDPAKVLLEGTTPFVNFWAEANSSKVIEIPTIYPSILFKPLAKDGELNGEFDLTIGVQEAYFADGSFWRRQASAGWLNLLFYDRAVANRFPSLASISPTFPTLWADRGGGRVIIRPCEAKPRSSASAFPFMSFQETTCQDNMASTVDERTGQQRCGRPSPGSACYSTCNDGWCNVDVVINSRCSGPTPTPTPTPTPSPTPKPCEPPKPGACCGPFYPTIGPGVMGDCYWDCGRPFCQPGQQLDNDCVAANADGSCPDGFSRGQQGAGVCCPQVAEGGGGCDPSLFQECLYVEGARWDESSCRCIGYPSPVLVDITGDGFSLTSAEGGVLFDMDGDGRRGRLAWTSAGSDDAFLVLDRDGNGTIDRGAELFGNFTPPVSEGSHGFTALAEFDRREQGGNPDGVIDAGDSVFARLRLWRDSNHDGVSQPDELYALPALEVAAIELDYKESKRADAHGNRFRYRAKVWDGKRARVGRWAWDVFLVPAP